MEDALTVEVDLLAEDAAAIRRALVGASRDLQADLSSLLEQGLTQYAADESAWHDLEDQVGPEAEAKRQDLKRRETQALLVSMRAHTIAAEKVMRALGETVHTLGAQLHANRREMWPMRQEATSLEARLKELTAPNDGSAPPSKNGGRVLAWLRRWLT
jgi:hypothetical protein